ncbi:hypothetical protein NFI96_002713 [Prochilodus magdalenae]|nr:hypothetical protein NFI96_002713 [Prochilodus magdalenae]
MPKVKKGKAGGGVDRAGGSLPLADQLLQSDTIRSHGRVKNRGRKEEEEDEYVDEKLSRKILEQARIQQEELQTEFGVTPEVRPVKAASRCCNGACHNSETSAEVCMALFEGGPDLDRATPNFDVLLVKLKKSHFQNAKRPQGRESWSNSALQVAYRYCDFLGVRCLQTLPLTSSFPDLTPVRDSFVAGL